MALFLNVILANIAFASNTPTEFNVKVLPSLTVMISDVVMNEPLLQQVSSTSTTLSVLSNNVTGYNTMISMSSDSNSLIHTINPDYSIPSITASTTKEDFPLNRWGFSVDDTAYIAMPNRGDDLILTGVSSNIANEKSMELYFATKVDATTPAGTYTNSMLVTVVPNYAPINLAESYGLAGKTHVLGNDGHKYYSMQDMTPAICNAADKEESTLRVVDERDGKVYWITKLKDGNCWMTQNLDFDIEFTQDSSNSFSLWTSNVTPELSDVDSTWTSVIELPSTSTEIFNNINSAGVYSYDPGNKYFPNGTGAATDIDCSAVEDKNDCHYHVGNYYQWNAATAGTGETITNADALGSICPKGWRLPISNSNFANYSFGNLLKQYDYTGNNQDDVSDSILLVSPFFFMRDGYIYSGALSNQGSRGYYWSSSAYINNNYAYSLYSGSNNVHPSNVDDRSNGFNIRCVAHGNQFKLNYDANSGINAPSSTIVESNSSSVAVTIASVIPTKERYSFLGWADSSTAVAPDYVYVDGAFAPATIEISEDKTLYAVWKIACDYIEGSSWDFAFVGEIQPWTVPAECPGTYKLEVWGSQGQNSYDNGQGGYGGYSVGTVDLVAGNTLYVAVGNRDGYNGGGVTPGASGSNAGANGGGATHIAANVNRGVLANYASHRSEILIVAGGGGGAGHSAVYQTTTPGGVGGGITGGTGGNYNGRTPAATGGTQTAGGSGDSTWKDYGGQDGTFGQGHVSKWNAGGGGGWYGGGSGIGYNGGVAGGGGSGYIGGVANGSTTSGVNSGNGKARITFVELR